MPVVGCEGDEGHLLIPFSHIIQYVSLFWTWTKTVSLFRTSSCRKPGIPKHSHPFSCHCIRCVNYSFISALWWFCSLVPAQILIETLARCWFHPGSMCLMSMYVLLCQSYWFENLLSLKLYLIMSRNSSYCICTASPFIYNVIVNGVWLVDKNQRKNLFLLV